MNNLKFFLLASLLISVSMVNAKPDSLQVIFDHVGGFYTEPFDLNLNVPDESYSIVYTIDGSNPQTSLTVKNGGKNVTIKVDPKSDVDRPTTPCYIVRASLKNDSISFPLTQTYVFLSEVIKQTNPGGGFPNSNVNDQIIDLDMNSTVSSNEDLIDALKDIPSISIVTDLRNLFSTETGIYVNALYNGPDWERFCSVELLNPNGEMGFSINCGLSIRGGWSRHGNYPKHGFHLEFKSKYGPGKIKYPLFGDEGVKKFDKIDLRCEQNFSWNNKDNRQSSTYIRDVFARDTQRDLDQPYTRSRFYHLYLNGMYWGLYQSQERVDEHYCQDYFNGEEEDYDVIKVNDINYSKFQVEAKQGKFDSWQKIYELCQKGFESDKNYYALEGKDVNGNSNGEKVLVNIDNLIDYMLIIIYTGDYDAPCTITRNNQPNNFYAIDNRNDKNSGFIFFNYDAESILLYDKLDFGWFNVDGLNINRVDIDMNIDGQEPTVTDFHPQWLHYKLTANYKYRKRVSDRVHKTFFNNGVFTPEAVTERFRKRVEEINKAIIAESARWGDAQSQPLLTKNDWENEVDKLYNKYFPNRTDIVINQLIEAKLFFPNDYVGVENYQNVSAINVYPNPTNGFIYLNNVSDNDDVFIYNMEGRKVFYGKVNESFDLNRLNIEYGLYLLKVKNSTFKIIYMR